MRTTGNLLGIALPPLEGFDPDEHCACCAFLKERLVIGVRRRTGHGEALEWPPICFEHWDMLYASKYRDVYLLYPDGVWRRPEGEERLRMKKTENDGGQVGGSGDDLEGRDLTPLRKAELEESKSRLREFGGNGGRGKRGGVDKPVNDESAGTDWSQVLARVMELYSVDTQRGLAEVFGVAQATVSTWSSGRFAPGFSHLEKVVTEKKVSWDWLLTGNGGVRPEDCAAGISKPGEAAKDSADPVGEVLERIDTAFREFLKLAETARTERPVRAASGLARSVVAVLWDMADAYYAERKRRGTGAGEA